MASSAHFCIMDVIELGLQDETVVINGEVTLENVFFCSNDSIISVLGALCLCYEFVFHQNDSTRHCILVVSKGNKVG